MSYNHHVYHFRHDLVAILRLCHLINSMTSQARVRNTVYTPYSSMPWSMIGNFVDTTGIKIIRSPDIFMYMPERVSTSNKDKFCDRRSCVSLNEIFTSKRRGICTASTQKSSHTLLIYTIYLYTFEINI